MKTAKLVLLFAVTAALLTGCSGGSSTSQTAPAPAPTETKTDAGSWGQPPAGAPAPMGAPAGALPSIGTVIETMDSGGYTYVLLDSGNGRQDWVAAPQVAVNKGEAVRIEGAQPMPGYTSKTLNRTFDMLYFAGAIVPSGSPMPAGGANANLAEGRTVVAAQAVSGVTKLQGGFTVGEVFSKKNDLANKDVKLRGQVVKVSRGIMGKNWIHIQDGTGKDKENDLTLTTAGDANKGDIVVVSGKLIKDKDFGMGYRYDIIIEDADVKVEKVAK